MEVEPSAPPRGAARLCPEARSRLKARAVPPRRRSHASAATLVTWKNHRVPKRRRRWEAIRVRLATWNVNSVKARLPRLLEWLDEAKTDIVCLQEIKNTTALFPEG